MCRGTCETCPSRVWDPPMPLGELLRCERCQRPMSWRRDFGPGLALVACDVCEHSVTTDDGRRSRAVRAADVFSYLRSRYTVDPSCAASLVLSQLTRVL